MVEIGGRPLLAHTIEHLRRYGVCDLVINLCHRPDRVMSYFGDGRDWGVRITYSVESGEPLGTAGGLRKAGHHFDRTFLVWYGDNLSNCHLDRLWRKHLLCQGEPLCGYKLTAGESLWWIDTPADLARVRAHWQAGRQI
jgi:NDP-sugar pyrophosphorylase family protein